jgi:hypothetical protein
MQKRITVVSESKSGRNVQFRDNKNGKIMTRSDFVEKIENGKYQNYHVRIINGKATPVSNPDESEINNLNTN